MKCIIGTCIIGLYLEFYLFGVGRLVCIHENREPLDLLGPWVPYCVDFNDLFLFLVECYSPDGLVYDFISLSSIWIVDSIPGLS